jgi:PAS domain S-box-containing protein
VFDSGDPEGEMARSRLARAMFAAHLDSARLELPSAEATVARGLEAVEKAFAALVVDVDRTFESYGQGRPPDIAIIDRHLAELDGAVASLERAARAAQALEARRNLSAIATRERLGFGLLVIVPALVGTIMLLALGRRRADMDPGLDVELAPPDVTAAEASALAHPHGANGSAPAAEGPMPTALDVAPDPVITIDMAGRIIAWNARALRAFGRDPETLRGEVFTELLVAPSHRDAIERVIARLDGVDDPGRRYEIAALDAEGHEFPVELALVPTRADGLPLLHLFLRDISKRRRIEAALRESEARARVVIEETDDGIVTIDTGGTITSSNPAAERIFGYGAGGLLGRHFNSLVTDPGTPLNGSGSTNGALAAGRRERMARRRNGSVVPVELTISDSLADGPRRWTAIVRDLTRLRLAEAWRLGQNRVLELIGSGAPATTCQLELIRIVEEQLGGAVAMIVSVTPGPALSVMATTSVPAEVRSTAAQAGIGPSSCTWGAAIHLGQRTIADDTSIHPAWARFRKLAVDHGLRSCWAEPISSAAGRVVGAFVVFRRRVHVPEPPELELVASAARMAALSIERSAGTGQPDVEDSRLTA